jgi:signal transduction histidine kinase
VVGCATLFGLLLSTQLYVSLRARGDAVTWPMMVVVELPPWYFRGLFVPVLVWAVRRFPLIQREWHRYAVIHLGLALGFVCVRAGLEAVWVGIVHPTMVRSEPITQLVGGMFRLRLAADLLVYLSVVGITSALDYRRRLNDRDRQASRLAVQLAESRLHALRMQLNPHFLFNALNSVSMLVRRNRNEDAVNLIAGMGELLRYVLDDRHPSEIPLRQELRYVEQYFSIEQVRFGDRIRFSIDAAPESLDARVPTLILQPLVENAVQHGVAKRARGGHVEVSAKVVEGRLELCVRDDGPGVPNANTQQCTPSVGIRNTRERLQWTYGDRSKFRLENIESGGAVATVIIPYAPVPRVSA